jgi:predicted dehydrogenase
MFRFAAVGIDHGHIFHHVDGLLEAGCEFAGYCPQSSLPDLMEKFQRTYPDAPRLERDAIFDDPSIDIVCTAAIPRDRAGIAVRAMRAGKDAMLDKPGVTSFAQLDEAQRVQRETGRIFSICFSERLCVPAAIKAGYLVADGAIGRVVQTIGMGPHKKGRVRPDWFWDTSHYGGIITDIASHQIDQFLHYTGSTAGEVVAAQTGNFATPEHLGFEDFGDVLLRSDRGTGYVRVDWYTPDGLGVWGDGRLTILGTDGYIELRKYVDIEGRPGGNHLFMANRSGREYLDCTDVPLEYFDAFVADVRDRSETAMTQAHVFEVCRLSLEAQARATDITPKPESRS